ncbi:hypothetical protein [Floridanema evergladense]|uniref:Uncharacterized protein n=1 Tax=Floridaenema evergladense BLCC-F167 TaxID=3153639 RepID=A0ABV4WPN5_9CYAN
MTVAPSRNQAAYFAIAFLQLFKKYDRTLQTLPLTTKRVLIGLG